MLTPDGPATVRLTWGSGRLEVATWGPGGEWAAAAAIAMTAVGKLLDHPARAASARPRCVAPPPHAGRRVERRPLPRAAAHDHRAADHRRRGRSPVDAPRLPARRAGARAVRRRCSCRRDRNVSPPRRRGGSTRSASKPSALGRSSRSPGSPPTTRRDCGTGPRCRLPQAAEKLDLIRGVGPWTIGIVLGPVCGDDDAVAIGDYHFPHVVSWNLAAEPRADDSRMVELLEPYRPQRGRVIRLLGLAGRRPPAYGPKRRILPMYRW